MSKENSKATTEVAQESSSFRLSGTVIFYLFKKGIGFIKPDDESPDIFVHHSDLPSTTRGLKTGMKVTYEVGQFKNRDKAVNVEVVE